MSLSLTYGSPEASCNKRADTYLGRRSASLMKEFWTLCIFVMTVSETIMVGMVGKVCECVCDIYVFTEDQNILRSFLIG